MLTNDRRRHQQPGSLQASTGQVLVHARLKRRRRIEDDHTAALEPMQDIHAKDHLLQRPRRHGPDDDGIECLESIGGKAQSSGHAPEVDGLGLMAQGLGGAAEVADVPTRAGGEDGETHSGLTSVSAQRLIERGKNLTHAAAESRHNVFPA